MRDKDTILLEKAYVKLNEEVSGEEIRFSPEFPKEVVDGIRKKITMALRVLALIAKERADIPRYIEAMSEEEINDGKKHGAGHGIAIPRRGIVKINPHMSQVNILLNFVHEMAHTLLPDASEWAVDVLTDKVAREVKIPFEGSHYSSYKKSGD